MAEIKDLVELINNLATIDYLTQEDLDNLVEIKQILEESK